MGKKGGKQSSSAASAKKAPKCTCDHPFQCDCGNRPERPSRGHKWYPEEQLWAGKGHKQKGGSGQTSSVAIAAKVTSVGKTSIAQWQRLPSVLLQEVCKRERRPPPKFKNLDSVTKGYKYRVIVQDAKASRRGGDHDFIFCPKNIVSNPEQAKEEAALLALLHMTPSIPHERKLPEPYKTTWLNAAAAALNTKKQATNKQEGPNPTNDMEKQPTATATSTNKGKGGAAMASSNLLQANNFTSRAQQRQFKSEKTKARNVKLRKREAERMANRDMQVFMSAQIRKQIETLLRGDANDELLKSLNKTESNEQKEEDPADDDDEDFVKTFVIRRLAQEGFTKSQASTGFIAVKENPSPTLSALMEHDNEEDAYMDSVYDECLQWLCVHLNEDQLPEGFDPRGRTLSVISAPKGSTSKLSASENTKGKQGEVQDPRDAHDQKMIKELIHQYGVTMEEATLLWKSIPKEGGNDSNVEMRDAFWKAICQAAGSEVQIKSDEPISEDQKESNNSIVNDEVEVLKAMFPMEEDLNISTYGDTSGTEMTMLSINLPSDGFEESNNQILNICYESGAYPLVYPQIFVCGGWRPDMSSKEGTGTAIHVDLIKFLSTLTRGEPLVFEIFNYTQELILSSKDNLPIKSGLDSILLPFLPGSEKLLEKKNSNEKTEGKRRDNVNLTRNAKTKKASIRHRPRRPREKSFFWSKSPKQTPAAESFPKLSTLMENCRKNLPAAKARSEFLKMMKKAESLDRVILVTGETGCGKTTQIPQFILEEAPKDAKIVVAQPRRLAATGVAARVADERGEGKPGQRSVGFVVRGEVAMCNSTRLMFCTTGVLLRQLQAEGALDSVTHIVVDEVHERHLDTDVLLGLLKECLASTPHLRVVLMSATMDADRFAAYWGNNTPRMHIPGFTHPVQDYFLEDVLSLTDYIPPKNGKKKKSYRGKWNGGARKKNAWADSEHSDDETDTNVEVKKESNKSSQDKPPVPSLPIEERLKRVNESDIDYDMLAVLVGRLIERKKQNDDGSILVFLPGAPEIARAQESILKITRGENMTVLPLHGGLQPRDQQRVFHSARRGVTKVILSTNVAETSITIPDCTMVVDTCKEKQSSYDPSNRMPMLVERFASRDSLKQRRGRAGRVRPGSCYKLISRSTFGKLPEHGEPEIKRCALDQTLLTLLYLGVEEGSGNFLSSMLDPPSQKSIDAAIYSLEKLGAVLRSTFQDRNILKLSPLGIHLAGIPAPPTVGKLLVMGSLLGCRSAALAIAAGMSVGRSPFLKVITNRRGNGDNDESKDEIRNRSIMEQRENLFKIVGNSDHVMLAAAYMTWESMHGGGGDKRRYLESLGLSINGVRDMKQLYNQLDSSLSNAGYHSTKESNMNMNSFRIIRSCVVSALAPAQIVRVQRPGTKYAATVEGAVEKDGVARELRFYTRGEISDGDDSTNEAKHVVKFYHGIPEERVFIHPSSANFSVGAYSCPWLVFHDLVRTSKAFLRDATECSTYDILLFGGKIDVQAAAGVIQIDNYVHLSANARIGALIGGLRRKVDDLLSKKVSVPSLDVADSVEMKLIVKLLRTDGMGQ